MKCPCHSGKAYATCCESFHLHENAPDALHLMRSRYSAYALGKTDYILHTTHPDHPDQKIPIEQKRRDIEAFSKGTQFIDLKIMEFKEEGGESDGYFLCAIGAKRGGCLLSGKKSLRIRSRKVEVSIWCSCLAEIPIVGR